MGNEWNSGSWRGIWHHLAASMPNYACIGFTGAPIIMEAKKRAHEIFGEFIDR
jgi:type I site-specific restriction-modification system R (restriction) subunit